MKVISKVVLDLCVIAKYNNQIRSKVNGVIIQNVLSEYNCF